jgi:hypothetical protein
MQSRRLSLVETMTNVVVGYVLAVTTQITVFPWFGLQVSLGDNLAIGALFLGISLVRGYALRRLFEWIGHRKKGPAAAGPKSRRYRGRATTEQ